MGTYLCTYVLIRKYIKEKNQNAFIFLYTKMISYIINHDDYICFLIKIISYFYRTKLFEIFIEQNDFIFL